jgi:hypothetical protein
VSPKSKGHHLTQIMTLGAWNGKGSWSYIVTQAAYLSGMWV